MATKKIIGILLSALLLFGLTACEVSTSSTSTTTITTSTTDENGNVTTNTVTSEMGVTAGTNGVSTTDNVVETTTTTPADDSEASDEDDLFASLTAKFSSGAEGVSNDGDRILFAYDDPQIFSYGAMIIVTDGGERMLGREGEIVDEEEQYRLVDDEIGENVPFGISDGEDDDTYVITFQDGDSAVMTIVDQETILRDMIATLAEFSA